MPFPDQVERWRSLVRRHAPADLQGDPEFERIALATLQAESGGNPQAVGDQGASVGLFQLHERGLGSGLSRAQRSDPDTNASRAIPQLAEAYRRTGGDPVKTYTLAINPGATPDGPQVSGVMSAYRQGGGGGKVMASVQEAGDVDGPEILAQLEAAKGKPVSVRATNPTVKTKRTNAFGRVLGEEDAPNPEPTYRYTYADGTYVDVAATNDRPNNVVGGTALTSLAREQKAASKADSAGPKTITVGGKSYTWNPDADTYEPTPGVEQPAGAAEKPVMIGGKPYRWVPNYPGDTQGRLEAVPIAGADAGEKGAKPGRVFTVGRTIFRENDDGTVTRVESVAPDPQQHAPQTAAEIEADALQNQLTSLQIQKAQQGLTPGTLLAIQNHLALVDQLEKLMREDPKRMPPDLAQRYIDASQANMEAAFRGTTVFDQQKEQAANERARRSLGADLLNTRLQVGSSLASSLTSSAFGSGVMMPAGKSSLGYAPAALAMGLTEDLQGGPDVVPFARSMLMGAGVGPAPAPSPVVNAPPGGFTVNAGGAGGGEAGGGFLPPLRPSMPR